MRCPLRGHGIFHKPHSLYVLLVISQRRNDTQARNRNQKSHTANHQVPSPDRCIISLDTLKSAEWRNRRLTLIKQYPGDSGSSLRIRDHIRGKPLQKCFSQVLRLHKTAVYQAESNFTHHASTLTRGVSGICVSKGPSGRIRLRASLEGLTLLRSSRRVGFVAAPLISRRSARNQMAGSG